MRFRFVTTGTAPTEAGRTGRRAGLVVDDEVVPMRQPPGTAVLVGWGLMAGDVPGSVERDKSVA